MPRYKIIHRTYYNYSDFVELGKHNLRLRPRENYELHVNSFTLKILPEAKLFWHRDVEGNSVAIANFETSTQQLFIESEVILEQFNESPLNFLVADYALSYPFIYEAEERFLLSAYMLLPQETTRTLLNDWIYHVYKSNEPVQTYTLLQNLTAHIYKTLRYQAREEEGVQSVEETLSLGSGSCRDFALLLMEAVKCLGLAARFVSGYLYAPLMVSEVGSTHAWAEVYLPGAGWKGFDPTIGNIVGRDHIPVAVSRLPESVPPISGTFAGVAKSTLDVGVWVSQI
ncbi:MAG TPA: cysteine protease [Sulfurimonas sp. UBA12504]|nr:MAG: cysteine protease [Sulfurimonas sp. GWF2_37_8]DAB30048.1 MAG TPA: cysteine protease [Sulfurimonas sp. UBA12504]